MKVLVLELARLGDIYMAWPALRALRRSHPDAQIDVLTRPNFTAALDGLEAINNRVILPSRDVLEPLVQEDADIPESFRRLSRFTDSLKNQNYDWIINLSFSPFSSYLVHSIAGSECKVSGFSRHQDGYLSIPDDISAYFYAQVGVHRSNRIHLCEIFGTMCGVDLELSDWRGPTLSATAVVENPTEILFHVGASEGHKQLSATKIANCINHYLKVSKDRVALIGGPGEVEKAESIMNSVNAQRVTNLVGKTKVSELFSYLAAAEILVGADSAPQHMASLVNTPCLNISFPTVNFWETGPRAKSSIVLRIKDEDELMSDEFARILLNMRTGGLPDVGLVTVSDGTPAYRALTTLEADFQWDLLKAIYLGDDFPAPSNDDFFAGVEKLEDVNKLMIEQMEYLKAGGELTRVASIIDRAEEVIETIAKLVPSLAILVRWYQTEKVRLGPDSHEAVLERSLAIQIKLGQVIQLYRDYQHELSSAQKETP